ncbi:MAG: short-chain dehydrogenase [Bacteroidetes bacterium]|nr:MAG: short-chain dehydrogenase [Bacteroidota bacterium]
MKKKLSLYHRFLKYKGIYGLAWRSLIKLLIIAGVIAIILVLAQQFINDLHSKISVFLQQWNAPMTLIIFFTSETLLGLIPPDFFIAWAGKTSHPMLMLSILAILSYIGGVVAFFIGRWIRKFPKIHHWLEKKLDDHLDKVKRYGGFLIVFSALLPLPFSTVSMVAGMVNYPKKNFLLLGLTRLLRFYLYALVLFHVI